jgi:hypothetical protein
MELAVTLVAPSLSSACCSVSRLDFAGNTNGSVARRSASTSSDSSPDPIVLRHTNAYANLCVNGGRHFVVIQREVMTALSLDLISQLERNMFPTLDSAIHQQLCRALRSCVQLFDHRMRTTRGLHSAREYLVASCAHAYVDALLRGRRSSGISLSILEAAQKAVEVCFAVWDQKSYAGEEQTMVSQKPA